MNQTDLSQAQDIADSYLPEPIVDYSRLNRDEIALIHSLYRAGKTQVEIAQIVKCSQPTVSKWLSVLTDPLEEAKHILRTGSPELAKRVIAKADVAESLEVLDRLDVAPRKQNASGSGNVTVLIGMPGQPAGPDPLLIDVKPG